MFEWRQRRAMLVQSAADALLTLAAFEAARATRAALPLREFTLEGAEAMLVRVAALAAVLGAGRWSGAYAGLYADRRPRAFAATLRQQSAATVALLTCLYLLHIEPPVSRLFLALLVAYIAALQLLLRSLGGRFRGKLGRLLGAESSVVIVGSGDRSSRLAAELEASRGHGVQLLAVLDCDEQQSVVSRLEPLLLGDVVDEVIICVPGGRLPEVVDAMSLCDEHGVTTRVAADVFPNPQRQVYFDRLCGVPLLTFSTAPSDEMRLVVKRAGDLLFAAASLVVLCVPMAAVAALVKGTSKGPVLFRQRRCGLNGRVFTCYKFRSMVADAEERREEVEHLNEKDGPAFKIRDDPRLTAVGGFLRRYSIDEWPQFWNVLKGEMAIVGPRPALPSEVERYQTWQRRRLRMRPGLTCLWAIRGRDKLDFASWMETDLEYIDTWSLLLDLRILAKTVPVVLSGRDAA